MKKGLFSFQGKILYFCLILVTVSLLTAFMASHFLPLRWATILTFLIIVPLTIFTTIKFTTPIIQLINALRDSTDNIKDHDFSVTIASNRNDELGDLVKRHNEIGQLLRDERYHINQRELLLDTVLQSTPVAMLLCDDRGRVVYSNIEARQLLADGRRIQSAELSTLLDSVDAGLSSAILAQKEGLISVGTTGSDTDTTETYYLSCRFFSLNGRIHQLHLIRRMTREIARQEVNTWKRVIRVISHELNNSLAPISSLSHSGKIALAKITSTPEPDPDSLQKLDKILLTIGERASHLKDFIEGYARFARLPAPRIQSFDLVALVDRMLEQQHFEVVTHHSRLEVQLDQTQFEQVLINLLKNAREASGEQGQVQVKVEQRRDTLLIVIADDGPGMSEQVMQQALLPFYSTKSEGTGLGLPLCREIIEAHGGQLSIKNGADKGLEVVLRLPQGESR